MSEASSTKAETGALRAPVDRKRKLGKGLGALLGETTMMETEPQLQFEPDANASYSLAVRTLQTIKASGVTNFGFVGNEKYRQFDAGA